MRAFFVAHADIVYFAYGLAFFLMGWSIWFQQRPATALRLGRHLHYLALFGLLHGLSEWGYAFMPGLSQTAPPLAVQYLSVFNVFLVAVSFLCLYMFGAGLLADTDPRWRWVPAVGVATMVLWLVNLALGQTMNQDEGQWLTSAVIWARYLLAFPGSLLAALALRLQAREFRELGYPGLIPDLRGAGAVLLVYAVAGGLLVPAAGFFPANVLNSDLFLALGLPSPIIRAACAVIVAFYMVRLLRVFDAENRRRLERVEAARAAAEERERLGRDLHDGILQSVFAAGLGLEMARERLAADPEDAGRRIALTLERLDRVMGEIRAYITGLCDARGRDMDLREQIALLVTEFRHCSGVQAVFESRGLPAARVPRRLVNEAAAMVREALSNVSRHARARQAEIVLDLGPDCLTLMVRDDGQGFDLDEIQLRAGQGGHYGLRNMARRTEGLGGQIQIESAPGKGTTLQVTLPIAKGEVARELLSSGTGADCR